jgi:lipopolysaccharide export system permease protein
MSGTVSFSSDYSRIIMDLRDGEIHEVDNKTFLDYRRLRFERHRVTMPASGFGFQRSDASTTRRDDRTMSAQMMQAIVDSIAIEKENKISNAEERMARHLRGYFHGDVVYYSAAPSPFMPEVAADRDTSGGVSHLARDTLAAVHRALNDARQLQAQSMAEWSGMEFDARQIDRFKVEIYKKYSIPVACLVFALIGVPLGMMARRGGFGVGAGLSLGFFLFYWACLIGGEKLADRGELSPFVGMWVANIILGILGVFLVWRTARESRVIDWEGLADMIPGIPRIRKWLHSIAVTRGES